MHSFVTSKNVKWPRLIWPTLYILSLNKYSKISSSWIGLESNRIVTNYSIQSKLWLFTQHRSTALVDRWVHCCVIVWERSVTEACLVLQTRRLSDRHLTWKQAWRDLWAGRPTAANWSLSLPTSFTSRPSSLKQGACVPRINNSSSSSMSVWL